MAKRARLRTTYQRLLPFLALLCWPAAAEVEFPRTLGTFEHARFIDFAAEASGQGYSHSYSGPGATASIFVYPGDGADLSASLESAPLLAEFERSARELEAQAALAGYASFEVIERGRPSKIGGELPCLSMLASYTDGPRHKITWLCVMPLGPSFLKLRYTVAPGAREEQGQALVGFQQALVRFIEQMRPALAAPVEEASVDDTVIANADER